MLQNYVAKWGDQMFEKDMASVVREHALAAALVMFIPYLGIIPFVIILWHMYSKMCKKCGTSLTLGNIFVGVAVNAVIGIVVNIIFGIFPFFGWLGTSFAVYVQFYLSGKSFIETLRVKTGGK
jgi:hypothetical protein